MTGMEEPMFDGYKLKRYRLARLITVKDLAERSEISAPTIYLLEKGGRTPCLTTIKKLLNGLELTAKDAFSLGIIKLP